LVGDCDDADGQRASGLTEVAGGIDEDCDGVGMCFFDADGDGVAEDLTLVPSPDARCLRGHFSALPGDCDDTNARRSPLLTEVLGNLVDEDCSGTIPCFADGDSDGFGAGAAVERPAARGCGIGVSNGADCDDSAAAVYPGAQELAGNGADEDCDGDDHLRLRVDGLRVGGVRTLRVRISGLPPNTPARIYASRTNGVGQTPCPVAGQMCGDLVNAFVFAGGVSDARGVLEVQAALPANTTRVQGFTQVQGQLGRSMVAVYTWP
jgi:hypothetical protein